MNTKKHVGVPRNGEVDEPAPTRAAAWQIPFGWKLAACLTLLLTAWAVGVIIGRVTAPGKTTETPHRDRVRYTEKNAGETWRQTVGFSVFREPVYMWEDRQDLLGNWYPAEGPLTPSGKRHGHWRTWLPNASRPSHEWYWYGKVVPEGEFVLKQKQLAGPDE